MLTALRFLLLVAVVTEAAETTYLLLCSITGIKSALPLYT